MDVLFLGLHLFFYFLIFGLFLFWRYKANQAHQKQKLEEEEKYKAELLIAAKKAEAANRAKTEFLQRMSHPDTDQWNLRHGRYG